MIDYPSVLKLATAPTELVNLAENTAESHEAVIHGIYVKFSFHTVWCEMQRSKGKMGSDPEKLLILLTKIENTVKIMCLITLFHL